MQNVRSEWQVKDWMPMGAKETGETHMDPSPEMLLKDKATGSIDLFFWCLLFLLEHRAAIVCRYYKCISNCLFIVLETRISQSNVHLNLICIEYALDA